MDLKIGEPNPKQLLFLKARNRYTCYGGARGGGKSWVVRTKSTLMALRFSGIKILFIRRTYPELRDNHIIPLKSELQGIAIYKELEKSFVFPNGSRIRFGYCDNENDVQRYQGQEYDIIFIDEATQLTEFQFNAFKGVLRGANNFPKRMYLTCNPGGVGHAWVKRLFIDMEYTDKEKKEDYLFIPAKVTDNKFLIDNDTGYIDMLNSLPEDTRRAWVDGDWDIFEGQYFGEFRREIHTCEPFELDNSWRRYFAMDYGLDMLAGYFIAVDSQGKAYVYKEVYKPNLIISDAIKEIKEHTTEDIYQYIAPPDMWNRRQDTGKSVAELFSNNGIYLHKAENNRIQGWLNVKEWLKPIIDEKGNTTANLVIFNNCTNLIRCIPLLQHDKRNPNDCANEPHDITHAPDALRYFIASRPTPKYIEKEKKNILPDALRTDNNTYENGVMTW